MKKISNIFILLAIILSDVMCAVVAYSYAALKYATHLTSAPAWVAFVYVIPYGIGILTCVIIAAVLRKRIMKKEILAKDTKKHVLNVLHRKIATRSTAESAKTQVAHQKIPQKTKK